MRLLRIITVSSLTLSLSTIFSMDLGIKDQRLMLTQSNALLCATTRAYCAQNPINKSSSSLNNELSELELIKNNLPKTNYRIPTIRLLDDQKEKNDNSPIIFNGDAPTKLGRTNKYLIRDLQKN